jgi:hypothetical protein
VLVVRWQVPKRRSLYNCLFGVNVFDAFENESALISYGDKIVTIESYQNPIFYCWSGSADQQAVGAVEERI